MILRKIIANFFFIESSLFSCSVIEHLYVLLELYYELFKTNVRDLAKAKYEDTYLLTTFKLHHVF